MAGYGKEQASPAAIEVNEKYRRALEMRKAGATFQQIADAEGYADRSGAKRAVMAALDKTLREPAEDVRDIELIRLDEMHGILWEKMVYISETENIPDLTALMNSLLRISDKRSRLLGLDRKDAPITVPDFPTIQNADDAVKAISILIDRATAGQIALSDAISLATLINKHWETLSGAELLERLKRLEEQNANELERR